jgi:hypothetical protein
VHLGLGGASGAGAVALLQPAQAVVFLDLPALVADADPAVVELGAASVFADGGGEDVDVVVGVADGDPAAGRVVDGEGDAGGLVFCAGNPGLKLVGFLDVVIGGLSRRVRADC